MTLYTRVLRLLKDKVLRNLVESGIEEVVTE